MSTSPHEPDRLSRQVLRPRAHQTLCFRQRREAHGGAVRCPGRSQSPSDRGGTLRLPQPLLVVRSWPTRSAWARPSRPGSCSPRSWAEAQTPPPGHRAGQPAEAVEPGTGRQVLPPFGHPGGPHASTRPSGPATSIPSSRTPSSSARTSSPARRSPTSARHAGIWWSSTKPTGCATSTSPPTRSPTPSSRPWPRSARCC